MSGPSVDAPEDRHVERALARLAERVPLTGGDAPARPAGRESATAGDGLARLALASDFAVDTLCRTIASIEVPPGVLTALIGTPFFLWLFALARRSW